MKDTANPLRKKPKVNHSIPYLEFYSFNQDDYLVGINPVPEFNRIFMERSLAEYKQFLSWKSQ